MRTSIILALKPQFGSLGGTLSRAERLEAWRYEALLSIAWRDLERARRAVRAMYAIQTNYQPIDLPPDLLALFDEERPPPAPEPEWHVDGRYVLQLPADAERDARWWSMGHGFRVGTSFMGPQGYYFSGQFGYVSHSANDLDLGVNTLHLWGLELGAGAWWTWGPVDLSAGPSLGVRYVSTDINQVYEDILDTSETDDFLAPTFAVDLKLSYRLFNQWSVSFSIAPELLIRNYQEQPHFSYFLPFLAGVRYGH